MRIQTYDQPSRAASPGRQSHLTNFGKIVTSSSSLLVYHLLLLLLLLL